MNTQKIALVIDSGVDISKEYREKYPIYVLPLKVIYPEREFISGVDITSDQIFARMAEKGEIPSTSLPSYYDIMNTLDEIKAAGFEKVLCFTISSSLSGTYNQVCMVCEEVEDLETAVIDTKNLSIGCGFLVMEACDMLENGESFEKIAKTLKAEVPNSKIFVALPTLEYLKKGGRIGAAASFVGNALGIKPLITMDAEGKFAVMDKKRGWERVLTALSEAATVFAMMGKTYQVCMVYGQYTEEAKEIGKRLKEVYFRATRYMELQVSPVLGVHTGPGLIGIGIKITR